MKPIKTSFTDYNPTCQKYEISKFTNTHGHSQAFTYIYSILKVYLDFGTPVRLCRSRGMAAMKSSESCHYQWQKSFQDWKIFKIESGSPQNDIYLILTKLYIQMCFNILNNSCITFCCLYNFGPKSPFLLFLSRIEYFVKWDIKRPEKNKMSLVLQT